MTSLLPSKSWESWTNENNLVRLNDRISQYTNYDNITNPLNFKSWWNTLISSTDAPYLTRVQIYESALHYLPASYKLWYNYLKEARDNILQYSWQDNRYKIINDLHERALIYLSKMPRIWWDYTEFLIEQCLITKTRKVFNSALKALPITQHEKIWKAYLAWAKEWNCPKMIISVFKRYIRLNPDIREDFVLYLINIKQFGEASQYIIDIWNDEMFNSSKGKTKFNYWLLLCEIIETYPEEVKTRIDCENVIRHGLVKYTDEIGMLWVALGSYYIKWGIFGKAREIFEEAMTKVLTARDFTLVFNAYLKFEEELAINGNELEGASNEGKGMDTKESTNNIKDNDNLETILEEAFDNWQISDVNKEDLRIVRQKKSDMNKDEEEEEDNNNTNINFKFLRLTNLLERRPFWLSSTILRQNPNNVNEWLKRINLFTDYKEQLSTYEEALGTVIPDKAYGKLSDLYISLAEFFTSFDEIYKANEVYNRATEVQFKKIEENIHIWLSWCESHIKYNNIYDAYLIIKTVCTNKSYFSYNKSLKLWSWYVDLEINIGSIDNVRAIYNKMIELKIANLQTIFNYCHYLETHSYFEETFRVYEQAIEYFTWPSWYDIWWMYFIKFIERYKESKIERFRDMYDQVFLSCPKDKVKIFYYIASNHEETYGLLNTSISLLDKAVSEIPKQEQPEVFSVLISKTAKYFGITKTRNVFNKALNILDKDQILEIGWKYASIEMKLGEIERSRGIFIHLSQFCDPSKEEMKEDFWKVWSEFEINHGNVETYQEMERIKRSVENKYSLNVTMFSINKE